ncbi:hypothetical protein QKW52_02650 [Bacillus sonorensis]|nr:hypothetical protein [Bacillus sonorensis]
MFGIRVEKPLVFSFGRQVFFYHQTYGGVAFETDHRTALEGQAGLFDQWQ